jgi:hypothetical protein
MCNTARVVAVKVTVNPHEAVALTVTSDCARVSVASAAKGDHLAGVGHREAAAHGGCRLVGGIAGLAGADGACPGLEQGDGGLVCPT